jgi:hypothetical protein
LRCHRESNQAPPNQFSEILINFYQVLLPIHETNEKFNFIHDKRPTLVLILTRFWRKDGETSKLFCVNLNQKIISDFVFFFKLKNKKFRIKLVRPNTRKIKNALQKKMVITRCDIYAKRTLPTDSDKLQ